MSQIEDCVGAVANLEFSAEELAAIDALAVDDNMINLWSMSSEDV
jgi:L-glyceraldehyde 3-phosphate reductase